MRNNLYHSRIGSLNCHDATNDLQQMIEIYFSFVAQNGYAGGQGPKT